MTDTKFIKQVKNAAIKLIVRNALIYNSGTKVIVTNEDANKFAEVQLKQVPLPRLLTNLAAFLFTYRPSSEEKKKYKKEIYIIRKALKNLDKYGKLEP